MLNQSVAWPSAVVALGVLGLITAVSIAGIIKYDDVDDALKVWGMLGTLVGVVTGSFVTYFFTKGAAEDAKKEAEVANTALGKIAGKVEPNEFEELNRDPEIRAAFSAM